MGQGKARHCVLVSHSALKTRKIVHMAAQRRLKHRRRWTEARSFIGARLGAPCHAAAAITGSQ